MFKSLTTISSLCLLISSNSVIGKESAHWQQPDYIQQSFSQIALQSEHGKSDGLLHKWQKPIVYTIMDRTGDQALHSKMVKQQFSHLMSITNHKIMLAKNNETANVKIIFGSENELETYLLNDLNISSKNFRRALNRNSVCVAQLRYGINADINSGVVIIPVDRARAHGKLMACVVEELTQIMGLHNDSTEVYPSIFNDHSHNDFLTGLDYLLLKLLYHNSLKPGMTAIQVHKELLDIFQTQKHMELIKAAESLVRLNSLENWLY